MTADPNVHDSVARPSRSGGTRSPVVRRERSQTATVLGMVLAGAFVVGAWAAGMHAVDHPFVASAPALAYLAATAGAFYGIWTSRSFGPLLAALVAVGTLSVGLWQLGSGVATTNVPVGAVELALAVLTAKDARR